MNTQELIDEIKRLPLDPQAALFEALAELLNVRELSHTQSAKISVDDLPLNSLAHMAQTAPRSDSGAETGDISEHSRDILEKEWGEYLMRYLHPSNDSANG